MVERERAKKSGKMAPVLDTVCTFQPRINDYSKSLPSKTPEDFCYGDYNKMQSVKQIKQLQYLQNEARQTPFQPAINRGIMDDIQSSLRLGSETDTYLARMQQITEAKTRKREEELRERERRELAECTFTPTIHQSPGFVRNMIKDGQTYRKKSLSNSESRSWNSSTIFGS
jgi:hypothetical protein